MFSARAQAATLPSHRAQELLTEVLHVLIRDELGHNLRHTARDAPGEVALVDDDSIGDSGRDERQPVGDSGCGRVVVEDNEGKCITEDRDEQGEVAELRVSNPISKSVESVRRHTQQTRQTCYDPSG